MSSRFGFGVGDLSFNLVWQGTALFLMYFYTDVLGLQPTVAGAIYLIAMIWDAVIDPFVATVAERTKTSFGKYRPWILLGAAPFAASYPLAFSRPPEFLAISLPAWALFTHMLLRTTYTIAGVPFSALQARLTGDSQERSVLAAFRMIGAATGALIVTFLTPVFVSRNTEMGEAEAYFLVAALVGAIALFGILYCAIVMREPAIDEQKNEASIWSDLVAIGPMFIRNPPLIRVFLIIIVSSICMGMFGKNMVYYFKYYLEAPELTTLGLVVPALVFIPAVPVWVWVAGKTSKRFALSLGVITNLIGYVCFFFTPASMASLIFPPLVMIGAGSAALVVMFWSMLPDTIEYGEAKTGLRAEARTFGFATFAQKTAVGINAILLGVLLAIIGFQPNEAQTEMTLLGMKAVMTLIPAAGAIAILIILRGYNLSKEEHASLLKQIEQRRRRAPPEAGSAIGR